MLEVVEGDIDPQIEFDVESDNQHRYVIVNILDKVLHWWKLLWELLEVKSHILLMNNR